MKTLQKFNSEYLDSCKDLSKKEIVEFLENFRTLVGAQEKVNSKLISMKVPENLLNAFKIKAKAKKTPYQTQIKILMTEWLTRSK